MFWGEEMPSLRTWLDYHEFFAKFKENNQNYFTRSITINPPREALRKSTLYNAVTTGQR